MHIDIVRSMRELKLMMKLILSNHQIRMLRFSKSNVVNEKISLKQVIEKMIDNPGLMSENQNSLCNFNSASRK